MHPATKKRRPRILLAPDSFKGSATAPEVAAAMAAGLRRVWPDADCVLLPVADGGEGTAAALAAATGGELIAGTVTGPLGEPATARWALLGGGETAVVELAEAAGLPMVPPDRRDPKTATTHGVGELLLRARERPGVRRIVVALGGSATNDGGAGLLRALGVRFYDDAGRELPDGGAALSRLARIDTSALRLDPDAVEIVIACDVDNPLTGPNGASAVFGPQKGASADDVARLDAALARYGRVLAATGGRDVAAIPGAGAAGGTAAGLLWLFPQAALRPGIEIVLDAVEFDRRLADADLVLTGEGRLDRQTLGGKVVAGVARRARQAGVPVAVLAGSLGRDIDSAALAAAGIAAVLPITPGPASLEEAMENAPAWIADAAERAARWMALGRGRGPSAP